MGPRCHRRTSHIDEPEPETQPEINQPSEHGRRDPRQVLSPDGPDRSGSSHGAQHQTDRSWGHECSKFQRGQQAPEQDTNDRFGEQRGPRSADERVAGNEHQVCRNVEYQTDSGEGWIPSVLIGGEKRREGHGREVSDHLGADQHAYGVAGVRIVRSVEERSDLRTEQHEGHEHSARCDGEVLDDRSELFREIISIVDPRTTER